MFLILNNKKAMKKNNPFYINKEDLSCLSNKQVLYINSFDKTINSSLLIHLKEWNLNYNEVEQLLQYLRITMICNNRINEENEINILLNNLKKKVKSFSDINLNDWIPITV